MKKKHNGCGCGAIIALLFILYILGWLIYYLIMDWQGTLVFLFILAAIPLGLFWLFSGGWSRETRRAKKLKDWTGQDYEDFWDERDED